MLIKSNLKHHFSFLQFCLFFSVTVVSFLLINFYVSNFWSKLSSSIRVFRKQSFQNIQLLYVYTSYQQNQIFIVPQTTSSIWWLSMVESEYISKIFRRITNLLKSYFHLMIYWIFILEITVDKKRVYRSSINNVTEKPFDRISKIHTV